MAKKNDKGFLTWLFAIISLVLGAAVAVASIVGAITLLIHPAGHGVGIFFAIVWLLLSIYFIWHSVMIILGRASNSWLYVIMAFVCTFVGGILMLIAKIIE